MVDSFCVSVITSPSLLSSSRQERVFFVMQTEYARSQCSTITERRNIRLKIFYTIHFVKKTVIELP